MNINVAFILDSKMIPAWQAEAIRLIDELEFVNIKLILHSNLRSTAKGWSLNRWLATKYLNWEQSKNPVKPKAMALLDFDSLVISKGHLHLKLAGDSDKSTIPIEHLGQVKSMQLDVLINFTKHSHQNLSQLASEGLWRFRFGREYRSLGQFPGFVEVIDREPFLTCYLLSTKSRGEIVYKSYSQVDPLYVNRTINVCLWKCSTFAARGLRSLRKSAIDENISLQTELTDQIDNDGTPGTFKLIRHLKNRVVFAIKKRLFQEKWILLIHKSDEQSYRFKQFTKLIPPADKFWADPFIYLKDGHYYIFIEESFMPPKKKGFISVIKLNRDGKPSSSKKIIEQPYHMSYPYVFEWEDSLFMVPETQNNRTVDLYKCTDFPYKWEFVKSLMNDVRAVDATILSHEGRYWMFVNIASNAGASSWDELHIFFADTPVSSSWTPHPLNPVVSDVRSARPAGKIFNYKQKLFRPSQNCSNRYGYGLKINEITRLSTSEYQESESRSIEPDWDKNIKAVHTINREGGITVIDGIWRKSIFF
jgi:hypothetical protein